jgi:hypothetical protein
MTAKEQLQQFVADLGEEQASRALELLGALAQDISEHQEALKLPGFAGMGDSGRPDLSEHVDELLAGRVRPVTS